VTLLPPEFADLEQYAGSWCLATEPERYAKRLASSMPEMLDFYEAVSPRAEAAMDYLDRLQLPELSNEATNLLHLLYSMIMVSFPVEAWGQPQVPDTGSARFDCFTEPTP
jgi:hypothetical protein